MRNTAEITVEIQRIKTNRYSFGRRFLGRYSFGRGFLRGLGRVLDLGATLSPHLRRVGGSQEDAEALAEDWKAVGDYIWFGINEVSRELERR